MLLHAHTLLFQGIQCLATIYQVFINKRIRESLSCPHPYVFDHQHSDVASYIDNFRSSILFAIIILIQRYAN